MLHISKLVVPRTILPKNQPCFVVHVGGDDTMKSGNQVAGSRSPTRGA